MIIVLATIFDLFSIDGGVPSPHHIRYPAVFDCVLPLHLFFRLFASVTFSTPPASRPGSLSPI
jgi:hypothetical protein